MLWHGKNFRGFLHHALQVLFDNTGTTLQSTNVEDAIKEVNSNLVVSNISNEFITSQMTGCEVFKKGNQVYGTISWSGDNQSISLAFTIPSSYTPRINSYFPTVNLSTGGLNGVAWTRTNRNINVYLDSVIPSNQQGSFSFNYFIN